MSRNFLSPWFTSARSKSVYLLYLPKTFGCSWGPYLHISLFLCIPFSCTASIWETRISEIYWLITASLCEGYWVLTLASNQRLHISPLAKAKQRCGFATPSVSGWCPQCLQGTAWLRSGAFINLHFSNSWTSSIITNWSQWAGSAEERQFWMKRMIWLLA